MAFLFLHVQFISCARPQYSTLTYQLIRVNDLDVYGLNIGHFPCDEHQNMLFPGAFTNKSLLFRK